MWSGWAAVWVAGVWRGGATAVARHGGVEQPQAVPEVGMLGEDGRTTTLARLLEQLERTPGAIHPEQYRSVVSHLVRELESVEHDETLRKLLDVFPAASQLYENLNYASAGLCRSPLDASLNAERAARSVLDRARPLPSG